MEEKKGEHEFTVRDRRSFSSETGEKQSKERVEPARQHSADSPHGEDQDQKDTGALPQLDFSSLVISLATTAQVSLGYIPNPQTNKAEQNLPAAQQMIDILAMLKEKTQGNLSQEEQALLDNVLFNLRMQYIKAAEKHQTGEKT